MTQYQGVILEKKLIQLFVKHECVLTDLNVCSETSWRDFHAETRRVLQIARVHSVSSPPIRQLDGYPEEVGLEPMTSCTLPTKLAGHHHLTLATNRNAG